MSVCALKIAGCTILHSEAGTPPAERALFDDGENCTTAGAALARLEAAGMTAAAVEEVTAALRLTAHRFARGEVVRQMILELGPAELFDGHVFHGGTQGKATQGHVGAGGYEGLLLDLPAVVAAIGVERAAATLQTCALAGLLQRVPEDAQVELTGATDFPRNGTGAEMAGDVRALVNALCNLDAAEIEERAEAPGRRAEDLLEALLQKGLSHERFARIQHSLNLPPPPSAGPLSEPEAWAIELRLGKGDHAALTGALANIERLEKSRGKRPVTVYLRSRAALLLGAEPPRTIAERVESLCATQAFPELSLLAAQAWLAAGEPDRAVPFARAVLLSTQSSRIARDRADDILAASPASSRSSHAPTERDRDRSEAVLSPLDRGWDDHKSQASIHVQAKGRTSQRMAAAKERPSSRFALALPRKPSRFAVPRPALSRPPPPPITVPSVYTEPPLDRSRRTRAWASNIPTRIGSAPVMAAETEPMVPVAPVITVEGHVSPEPPPPPPVNPDQTVKMEASVSTPLALVTQRRVPVAQQEIPNRPTPSGPVPSPAGTMRGASMPAYQSDPPPVVPVPRAPKLPRLTPAPAELAEALSLPPGLHGQIAALEDELPKTSLEARVLFTHMARRLGREYREKHGIQLRTTVESIEQMQAVLRDRFPDGVLRTREERLFVRRHGAFLSEILARTLEAEWVDLAPTEIGYWAMIVPPKTRVWPFGRVLRFLSRGHRERDLVSYYMELKNRAFKERT